MKNIHRADVLVAYTRPQIWRVVQRRMIANQASDKRDADYIAFLRIRRQDEMGNDLPSAITHIAKVKKIKTVGVDLAFFEKNMPEAIMLVKEKGWDTLDPYNKEYHLEWIEKLERPVTHHHGDRSRGQVCFYTRLSEIRKAKYIRDIKTEYQLRNP